MPPIPNANLFVVDDDDCIYGMMAVYIHGTLDGSQGSARQNFSSTTLHAEFVAQPSLKTQEASAAAAIADRWELKL